MCTYSCRCATMTTEREVRNLKEKKELGETLEERKGGGSDTIKLKSQFLKKIFESRICCIN